MKRIEDLIMAQRIIKEQKNEIRIVMVGKTESGKSRTGNVILGIGSGDPNKFEFSCSAQSETKVCKLQTAKRFGIKLDVVDTPGVFDTNNDNAKTQMEIKKCLLKTSPGPHAILFCVPMGRFTLESIETLHHFVGYFGPDLYEYVIVVFTRLDEWKEDQSDLGIEDSTPETYIDTLEDNLRDFLQKSYNNYCFFDNTLDPADDSQVRYLLQIIESNINRNKGNCYTNEMYEKIEQGFEKLQGQYSRDEIKQNDSILSNVMGSFLNVVSAPLPFVRLWC